MAERKTLTLINEARKLLVAGMDGAGLRAVHRLVEHASPAVDVVGSGSIDEALALDSQAPVLVPIRMPLVHLRDALGAGEAPEVALDAWRDEADGFLRACRKARRRVLVIDAAMLAAQPAACAEALGARLDLSFAAFPEAEEAKEEAGPALSAVHSSIAASLLAEDGVALELADELEAMIVGPVSPRSPSRAEIVSAARDAACLAEERDLLRENLKQMLVQTEELGRSLERSQQETVGLESRMSECLEALETARAELEASRAQASEQSAETSRLEQELLQTETIRASLAEERDLLRENLKQMLAEVEGLTARSVELERASESLKAEAADKHLLKAQVEALHRQLEDAHEAGRLRASVLGAEVLRLAASERDQRVRHEQERAALATELQAALEEIARIHASTSWRLTRPVRAARRRLPAS